MTATPINLSDVVELARALGIDPRNGTKFHPTRKLWADCLQRARELKAAGSLPVYADERHPAVAAWVRLAIAEALREFVAAGEHPDPDIRGGVQSLRHEVGGRRREFDSNFRHIACCAARITEEERRAFMLQVDPDFVKWTDELQARVIAEAIEKGHAV
jgi:hypothetical protein